MRRLPDPPAPCVLHRMLNANLMESAVPRRICLEDGERASSHMEQEKQMRQFLAAAALALAIATPAVIVAAPAFAQADVYGQNSLSPDPRIRSYQEYQRLVEQANNY